MLIDLHTHTTASDGTDTPAELVAAARAAGLDVLALTDHDSVRGWAEAEAALPAGLALVRGAEISCAHGGVSLHLLAYLFDPGDAALLTELDYARDDRVPRAKAIVGKLADAGVPVTWDQVLAQVGEGATVGRPHVADALVAAGAVTDRSAAFSAYLHDGSPYFVSHYAVDPVRAVRLVREAGGVPVLAHPGAARRGRIVTEELVAAMTDAGLAGLEIDHPDHDAATRARWRGLARDLGLAATGASDYHGTGKPNRLGQDTTDADVLDGLLAQASGAPLLLA